MLVTGAGYHFVEVPETDDTATLSITGSLGEGKAYLTYLVGDEYIPLINGTLVPDTVGYVLAQRLNFPLYILVKGEVFLEVEVSKKDPVQEYTRNIVILPLLQVCDPRLPCYGDDSCEFIYWLKYYVEAMPLAE